jgi:selenocysteine lyase/cysteine desulfurase
VVLRSANPAALVEKLTQAGIVVSARQDGVRFSFHFYNNAADVDHTLAVLAQNLPLLSPVASA